MPQNDQNWQRVGALEGIETTGSRGFRVDTPDGPVFGFVVQAGNELFAYENVCPHAGRQLNWGPHRFLTKDHSLIMCSAHGALFDKTTGACAAGPCAGEGLKALPLRRDGDDVEIDIGDCISPFAPPPSRP